jgi:hypothetical protein
VASSARPKHVLRPPHSRRRRLLRLGLVFTAAAALAAPVTGLVLPAPEPVRAGTTHRPTVRVDPSPVPMRVEPISRSAPRVRLTARPVRPPRPPRPDRPPQVTGHRFATQAVHVRTAPEQTSASVTVLARAQRVAVTDVTHGAWTQVVLDETARWVHTAYLAAQRPTPEPEPAEAEAEPARTANTARSAGPKTPRTTTSARTSTPTTAFSTAPCPGGSSVESGLVANAVAVHRAVCAAFPEVTGFGGVRPGDAGYHGSGQALDVMCAPSTGDRVAAWLRSNASRLGVSEVIWAQRIWTVQRSSEGWRWMEDRGSATANHYDHVHVSVY